MNNQLSITFLSDPKNQCASVLKKLIENNSVSERDMNLNGFRSRISDLRLEYGLNIRHVEEKFINQFGRKGSFRRHFLYDHDKPGAIKVYNQLNK